MPTTFPGVDSYIEDQLGWGDVHHEFISQWRAALNSALPDGYYAHIEERVRIVDSEARSASDRRADVVTHHDPVGSPRAETASGSVAVAPFTIPLLHVDPTHLGFIEIVRAADKEVVTVLELLSPTSKAGGKDDYETKRWEIHHSEAHLVEVDLLVGGARVNMARPLPAGDYYAIVSRRERRPECEGWAWSVRETLPIVPVPLHAPDPDIMIDLGDVYRATFKRGRYDRIIDRTRPLALQLSEADRTWAEQLARTPA